MKILNENHIITGNEFFRQIEFCPYDGDNYAIAKFISKWTSIRYLVGPVWKNKKLFELNIKDKHYPQAPKFTDTYEFIKFDDDVELLSTKTFNDNDIAEIDSRMHGCYRLWEDWGEHLIKIATNEQLQYIINTPSNLCPYCNKGVVVEKYGKYGKFNGCSNFPHCTYVENKLNDYYFKFNQRKTELEYLKGIIKNFGQNLK